MRFFTPEWHDADLSEEDTDAVFLAYEQHLEQIWPRLHATVRALAGTLSLNDALIRRVVLDRSGREVRLELRAGDDEIGYCDVDLTYLGAIVDASDVTRLAEAARDPETILLYDELDLAADDHDHDHDDDEDDDSEADGYVHRFLFWPFREIEILFSALAVRIAPRADGRVPLFPDRWVEIAEPAG
jgi:hypothetical protein